MPRFHQTPSKWTWTDWCEHLEDHWQVIIKFLKENKNVKGVKKVNDKFLKVSFS